MQIHNIINKINHNRQELQWYLPLDIDLEKDLWDKIRLDWNFHSSNMEGIDISFEQTQQLMLKRGEISGKKIKDCNQVKGHDDAVAEIRNHIKEKRPLTEHFIRGLHEFLLKEEYYNLAITTDGKPTQKLVKLGEYKSMPNDVETKDGLFRFASPEETKILMSELVEWCNTQLIENSKHPLLIATEFHYRFVRVHPFDDGNGRMARLLTNYILMYFDYPPIIIETNKKNEYLNALREGDKGNSIKLEEFFGDQLINSITRYIETAKGINIHKPGDLKKRILLLTKKVENDYMKNGRSNKYMVDVITNVYAPLLFETNKNIQDVKHLFVGSSWNYFEEPKDGKIAMMPMSWNLNSILNHFVEMAQKRNSYNHFKIMNWLTTFRAKDKQVDVEIAFKIFFRDFEYEIKAYVGQPLESSMFMGTIKKLINTLNKDDIIDSDDRKFTGFEYTVYKAEYGTLPIKTDIQSWSDTLGHKFVGYIEKRAGLNPHKEEVKHKPKFPFSIKKIEP